MDPKTPHSHLPFAVRWACLAVLLLCRPLAALADGGTISGTVDANPAKYLAETVVYLRDAPAAHAPATAVMDQKGMLFIPHVLTITVGDTVRFTNQDPVGHNVMSPDGGGYNLGTFGPHQERTHTFTKPGPYVQLCGLHPEMLAYIFVGANPYSAAVSSDGHFTLKDVPPGTYHVAVWNSRLKGADQVVTVAAGKAAEVRLSIHR